jgi:hypothetical protein
MSDNNDRAAQIKTAFEAQFKSAGIDGDNLSVAPEELVKTINANGFSVRLKAGGKELLFFDKTGDNVEFGDVLKPVLEKNPEVIRDRRQLKGNARLILNVGEGDPEAEAQLEKRNAAGKNLDSKGVPLQIDAKLYSREERTEMVEKIGLDEYEKRLYAHSNVNIDNIASPLTVTVDELNRLSTAQKRAYKEKWGEHALTDPIRRSCGQIMKGTYKEVPPKKK